MARRLFADRPYGEVSTLDVADQAGVTRALVNHYFGGLRGLYLAVLTEGVEDLATVPGRPVEESRRARITRNSGELLDRMERDRQVWLAVGLDPASIPDAEIRAVIEAGQNAAVTRMLAANADALDDTPANRLLLHGWLGLMRTVCRQWLKGSVSRAEVHALLIGSLIDLIERTAPAVAAAATDAVDGG